MKTLFCFLFLLPQLLWAQKENAVITEKMKPLMFQVEKQLSTQIKTTLEESLKLKDIAVRTSLRIDTSTVARKYNLTPKKSKFNLPGLDESVSNSDENLKNYSPTIQDVYLSVAELSVKVSSLVVFTDMEKSDIEKIIADDLSTLNLNKINYSFYKSKNLEPAPEPVVEKKVEVPQANNDPMPRKDFLPEESNDYSQWLLAGLALVGVLLVVAVFVVGALLVKQFKNMASSLSSAISQIDVTPDQGSSQRASQTEVMSQTGSGEDTSARIHHLFSQIADPKHFFSAFMNSFSGIRFYVVSEGLNPVLREEFKKKLSRAQHQEYLTFLQAMASGEVHPAKIAETSNQLARELSLYVHDAETFVGQLTRNKLRSLDPVSLKHLVNELNEDDFMTLAQVTDPVEMSLLLNENPEILERFESLEVREVRADVLTSISRKAEASHDLPPDMGFSHELKLREFVPENVEVLLNQKLGKEKTMWEELDQDGMESLYDFTIGLSPKEAALFVSMIPEDIRADVLRHLPDLKREQIKRQGFEVSRRSMELKHQFFQTLRA